MRKCTFDACTLCETRRPYSLNVVFFTDQVSVQLDFFRYWWEITGYNCDVYLLPKQLHEKVACLVPEERLQQQSCRMLFRQRCSKLVFSLGLW